MAGALQSDELGDVLEVLAKNVFAVSREYRHAAHAELEQLLFSHRIVHHVNRGEVNAFLRKKLFRPQATASTRLGKQGQFISDALHDRVQHCELRRSSRHPSSHLPGVAAIFRKSLQYQGLSSRIQFLKEAALVKVVEKAMIDKL